MNRSICAWIAVVALGLAGCTEGSDDGDRGSEPVRTTAAPTGQETAPEADAPGADGPGAVEEDADAPEVDAPEVDDPETPDEAPVGGAEPGRYVAPEGGVERGYDLEFTVSEDGAVIHGLVANVLESCDGESTSSTVTIGPELAWDVDADGAFSARYEETFDDITSYTTLEGRFTAPGVAEGTVRQETVIMGSVCDTYALGFTAELQ